MSKPEDTRITRRSFIEKSMIGSASLAVYPVYTSNDPLHHEKTLPGSEVIELDQPVINKGLTIMESLKKRRSTKEFQAKKLSHQHLSEVLWASDGVNREDGKRTAPSAMNLNIVEIYAVLEQGIYFYDHEHHSLVQKVKGDCRKWAGEQDFIYNAPLNLVYIANLDKVNTPERSFPTDEVKIWAAIEAGHQSENVYLYCASEGLGAVVRASMNVKEFGDALHFNDQQIFISIQTIGYKL